MFVAFAFGVYAKMPPADFYVSDKGADTFKGSKDAPFKTLQKAIEAVRAARKVAPDKNYAVELADGYYRLQSPLVFTLEDTAPTGFYTRFYAANTEGAILGGGVKIDNWQKCKETPAGFDKALADKLWEADLSKITEAKRAAEPSAKFINLNTLYKGQKLLPRARSERFAILKGVPRETSLKTSVNSTPAQIKRKNLDPKKVIIPEYFDCDFDAAAVAEIWVIPSGPWMLNQMPVESVDKQTRTLACALPSSYDSVSHLPDFENAFLVNYAPALQNDGEWVFDAKKQKLYLLSTSRPQDIYAPLLSRLIIIEGAINKPSENDAPVCGLRFSGIKFEHTDYYLPQTEPNYAIHITGAKDALIEDCVFQNLGGGGVRMDLCGISNIVRNCAFIDIGASGVNFKGYGLGTKKELKNNLIENCYFRRCGRVFMQLGALNSTMGMANTMRNCTVLDMHYNGISIHGLSGAPASLKNWPTVVFWEQIDPKHRDENGLNYPNNIPYTGGNNVIEYNEFFRTGETLGDSNAIYFSSGGLGDQIRHNFVHDLRGWYCNASIRMDDNQTGATISHNITYNNVGVGIISKGANNIINNFFVETHRGRYVSNDQSGMKGAIGISIRGGYPAQSVIEKNIVYISHEGEPAVLQLYLYAKDRWPFDPKSVTFDRNLFAVDANDQSVAAAAVKEFLEKYGWNKNSIVANPLFKNPAANDFSFPQDSPAAKLGIEPISLANVGIQGAMRARYIKPALQAPKIEAVNFVRLPYEPANFAFKEGMKVKVALPKGAQTLYYTLNGETPDEASPQLKPDAEFEIKKPCTFTVAAFADGKEDVLGDRIIFGHAVPAGKKK